MADRTKSGLEEAYSRIRSAILTGEIAPGSRVSQVKIAEQLNLSRTPVREALRMIGREGLVQSQRGRQIVVASASMADLDELYALRITLDCATAAFTVPRLSDEDCAEMRGCLTTMSVSSQSGAFDAYDVAHRQFHLITIRPAGERHITFSERLNEHAERFRRLYLEQPYAWETAEEEHRGILEACEARDAEQAAILLAHHYARIALTIIAATDPTYEPWRVRAAVKEVVRRGGNAGGRKPGA